MALARWIRRERPHLPVVGLSLAMDPELREWFARNCSGFSSKLEVRYPDQLVRFVRRSWVDNDPGQIAPYVRALRDEGFQVVPAETLTLGLVYISIDNGVL